VIILFFLITFKTFFLIFPEVVLIAAREGLSVWFNNVLPALLPFMIITNMLVSLGFAQLIGRTLSPVMKRVFGLPGAGGIALIIGLTSGYPIGAKAVADLQKAGELSTRDAQHLLAFCNNAGPLFILGVVGVGLFRSSTVGYILWIGHIFSAIFLGILLRRNNEEKSKATPAIVTTNSKKSNIRLGEIMGDSVKNAMESMLVIGGLIVFFSAVMAVLEEIGFPDTGVFAGLLAGIIEVTSGVRDISNAGISVYSIGITAFIIAFGGFSIHMQTFHFTDKIGIKPLYYIFSKLLHGIIASIITILLWLIFK